MSTLSTNKMKKNSYRMLKKMYVFDENPGFIKLLMFTM